MSPTAPITKSHLTAIALHISDVLGNADTSRAEAVMEEMGLSATSTYNTLAAITQAVVTEALTDAGVKIPSLRRGTITALFAHVRPGVPTCNRCGRLPLTLVDVAWTTVTETICPRDSGLYESEVIESVRSWTDGREYPAGTKATSDRIPLTEEGIRERGVSTLVDAALKETGATLMDMLSALVGKGLTPVVSLVTVRDPFSSHLFIDSDAIREFAQGARGAFAAMGNRQAPPPVASPASRGGGFVRSWSRLTGPEWAMLQKALLSAFPSSGGLEQMVAFKLGENLDAIASGSLSDKVYGLIQWSQARGTTERLFRAARDENPGNQDLRDLDR